MTKRSDRRRRRVGNLGWLALGAWLGAFVLVLLGYAAVIALLARLRYPSAVWFCELMGWC